MRTQLIGCMALAITASISFGSDGRIEISGFMMPYSITNSDSYLVTENLIGTAGADGITIAASDVTLDLNGFSLTGVPGSLNGIFVSGPFVNITIKNGTVYDWAADGVSAFNAQVSSLSDVHATGNAGAGLRIGSASTVKGCKAYANGGVGIEADTGSTILECTSRTNGQDGIVTADTSVVNLCSSFQNGGHGIKVGKQATVTDCAVRDNEDDGINAEEGSLIRNCVSYSNDKSGIHVQGGHGIVVDCTAYQNTDHGISAGTGSVVRSCVAYLNFDDGIRADARCQLVNNLCTTNSTGIRVTGEGNRLDQNHLAANATGMVVEASHNFVVRNTASMNYATNFLVSSENLFEVEENPGTNTPAKPWINISF